MLLLGVFRLDAQDHFVSPGGTPGGSGRRADPWDIATALGHPRAVQPGDVIWLLGGRYELAGTLISSLGGEEGRPIVVRQAPNHRAILDCAGVIQAEAGFDCLKIIGQYTWYWGFEITNSSPTRWISTAGSSANPRGRGIHSQGGLGTKLINLVVHDVGTGLFESQRSGIEIYGNIFYNNGWDAPDRSHGPGLYIRNRSSSPSKTIRDNIVFQHFRQAIQGFGSFRNVFSNFVVEGNALFNNGIGKDGPHRNIMFGNDNTDHVNNVFENNYTYYPWGWGAGSNMFSSTAGGCRGLRLLGNVFAHGPGRVAADINNCEDVMIERNLFFGKTFFSRADQSTDISGEPFRQSFPNNEYFGDEVSDPARTHVFLRPNQYEPSRAHIIVYNWKLLDKVAVDLSRLPIRPGDRYAIRNVQDYFGRAERGVYRGGLLQLPMSGWKVDLPTGHLNGALPPTLPEFGVFVLEWRQPERWLTRRTMSGKVTVASANQ